MQYRDRIHCTVVNNEFTISGNKTYPCWPQFTSINSSEVTYDIFSPYITLRVIELDSAYAFHKLLCFRGGVCVDCFLCCYTTKARASHKLWFFLCNRKCEVTRSFLFLFICIIRKWAIPTKYDVLALSRMIRNPLQFVHGRFNRTHPSHKREWVYMEQILNGILNT